LKICTIKKVIIPSTLAGLKMKSKRLSNKNEPLEEQSIFSNRFQSPLRSRILAMILTTGIINIRMEKQ
jgi:hypothetical protein